MLDVRVEENSLDVVYSFSEDKDIIMRFEKCMFNNLMTFSQVSLQNKKNGQLDVLNKAYSDNIGPMKVAGSCYVGGNHSYNDNNVTRTATTIGYGFFADGNELHPGDSGTFNSLHIEVENLIFDPREYDESEGMPLTLSTPLYKERVMYDVTGPNIEVHVTIEFLKDVHVSNYYGLQSMCHLETDILTPNGQFADWAAPDNGKFFKNDYPDFRTIVERTPSLCQSTFLYADGIGDHSFIADDSFIFSYGSYKSYHHLIDDMAFVADGTEYRWHGLYTWFEPVVDDEDVLIYEGADVSGRLLFVSAKKIFSGVKVLPDYSDKRFSLIPLQTVDGVKVDVLDNMLHINALCVGGGYFAYK